MSDTKTVSGNIVHIQDKGAPTALSVIVNITPKQSGSGTPSPSNVRPISGWESVSVNVMGKNLFDTTITTPRIAANGITFTLNDDGTVTANGTATGTAQLYWIDIPSATYADIWSGKVLNGCPSISGCSLRIEKETSPWTNYATDTGNGATIGAIPSNIGDLAIYCRVAQGTTLNNAVFKPMIRVSGASAEYEPYNTNSHITTTSLGRTVYGGTLDVVSGVLTVDRAMVTYNGSENWRMETGAQYTGSNFYIAKPSGTGNEYDVFQSNITNKFTSSMSTAQDGVCISAGYFNCILGNILGINNLADFKTWLASNNLQVVYPLATPQTYTLTGQNVNLLKDCYAWADSGDISITYETYLINGLFHKIWINAVKMFAPNDFTLERSDVYAGEITTCTGKLIADRIGWKYADMSLNWDYLPQEYLETILNLSGVFTITFENEEGVQFTEQCIRKGSTMTGTRFTDNDGNMMWKGVQFDISFINVHN